MEPELPPIEPELMPLVVLLFELGPASAAGMGQVPLTWADMQVWQQENGVEIPLWQKRLLRRLSSDYLSAGHEAQAHDAPRPWVASQMTTSEKKAQIAKHIRGVLRG